MRGFIRVVGTLLTLCILSTALVHAGSLNVPKFLQNDPRWATKTLGDPGYTMTSWGCGVTSGAMALAYLGVALDPGTLCDWLRGNGGFHGPYIPQWPVMTYYPNTVQLAWVESRTWQPTPPDLTYLKSLIDQNLPVVLETRIGQNEANIHFVVLTAYSGNDLYVNDPSHEDNVRFQDRFGDPNRWIYGSNLFKTGGLPTATFEPLPCWVITQNGGGKLPFYSTPGSTIIGYLPDNTVLSVTQGPIFVDGIAYYYHNQGGWSPQNGIVNGTAVTFLAYTRTPSPTGLTAQATSSTAVALAWSVNQDSVDPIIVSRDGAGDLATLAAGTTAYRDTAVMPATTYTYHVRMHNNNPHNGDSLTSNASVTTPGTLPLTSLTVGVTPATGVANQPTTVTAQATGGSDLRYQFWVGDSTATYWTLLRDYSTTSSIAWTPGTAGTFPLVVRVKEATSTKMYDLQNHLFYPVVTTTLSGVSLSTSPTSPQPTNTTVTLTATPVGGTAVQYQFVATTSAGVPTVLQSYATFPSVSWTPTTADTYSLQVLARETGTTQNPTIQAQQSYVISNTGMPLTAVKLVVTPSTGTVGNASTVTAQATGGDNLRYQFWVGDPTATNWTLLQDYSSSNTLAWTPGTAGTFPLVVRVKEATSTKMYDLQNHLFYPVVTTALSGVSLSTSPTSPQPTNTTVTLTATPVGGTAVQYQFVATTSAGVPTVLQSYATFPSVSWTPTTADTYSLQVLARETGTTQNPAIQAQQSYVISNTGMPLSAVKLVVTPSTGTVGNASTVTAQATDGYNLRYQFWVGDPTATIWTLLRDYSSSNTIAWTPSTAGTFPLVVRVKEVTSTNLYDLQNHLFYPVP